MYCGPGDLFRKSFRLGVEKRSFRTVASCCCRQSAEKANRGEGVKWLYDIVPWFQKITGFCLCLVAYLIMQVNVRILAKLFNLSSLTQHDYKLTKAIPPPMQIKQKAEHVKQYRDCQLNKYRLIAT